MRPSTPEGRRSLFTVALLVLAVAPIVAQGRLAIAPVTLIDVTDGSLLRDHTVLVEGERIVGSGLTPLPALQAATLEPARFFGRTDELGTVEGGKLADLVLLDANPLEDITNTQRIRAVVADGRLYRRSDLDRLLDEAEASNRQAEKQE